MSDEASPMLPAAAPAASYVSPTADTASSSSGSGSDAVSVETREPPWERKNGLSANLTRLNFVKAMLGPGVLSLPAAFKQCGLWPALVLVPLFGFLNNWCMLKLVHCSQELSRRQGVTGLDYGTVAQEACAASGIFWVRRHRLLAKAIVNTAIAALQLGVCAVSIVFLGAHMQEVVEEYTTFRAPTVMYFLFVLGPLVLLNFLRTLKAIAALSALGTVCMLVSLAVILQHLLWSAHRTDLPRASDFFGIAMGIGSIMYAFEGQAMVLPMENRLRRPQEMVGGCGVLSSSMAVVTGVYVVVGLLGFSVYGNDVQGSIALNLPDAPQFTAVKVLLMAIVFLGFVLQQYVVVEMTWPVMRRTLPAHAPQLPLELLFRAALVCLAVGIAASVPNLERIISLVGVTAGMFLAFVFPALIDALTFLPRWCRKLPRVPAERRPALRLRIAAHALQNAVLVAIGCFGCVAGLTSAIREFSG